VYLKKTRSFGSPVFDSTREQHHQQGPELLLIPVINNSLQGCCAGEFDNPIPFSERFASFGSNPDHTNKNSQNGAGGTNLRYEMSQNTKQPRLGDVTLPIADIMIVDMYGAGDSHRTNVTTISHGFFEFTLESKNGQEVLLAFLRASLPKDRIMDGQIPPDSVSTGSNSFDVEAFTASQFAERMERESFSEKIRRRVGRVVSSIEDSE
jgi:hypothetical protein